MRRWRNRRTRGATGVTRPGLGRPGWSPQAGRRAGLATLDYVLVLGVILPLAAFILWIGPRIIRLVYEMVCLLVSWPFL